MYIYIYIYTHIPVLAHQTPNFLLVCGARMAKFLSKAVPATTTIYIYIYTHYVCIYIYI